MVKSIFSIFPVWATEKIRHPIGSPARQGWVNLSNTSQTEPRDVLCFVHNNESFTFPTLFLLSVPFYGTISRLQELIPGWEHEVGVTVWRCCWHPPGASFCASHSSCADRDRALDLPAEPSHHVLIKLHRHPFTLFFWAETRKINRASYGHSCHCWYQSCSETFVLSARYLWKMCVPLLAIHMAFWGQKSRVLFFLLNIKIM